MTLKIISAGQVRQLLPMDECIEAMALAMAAASAGDIKVPLRSMMPLIDDSAHFALMPGSTAQPPVYGAKILSLHPANSAAGRPVIQGFVTLFDHHTGSPLAIIEGATLTAIRTAAASGLATRCLAQAQACTHGVFGTGVQAVTHIEAIAAVRAIERVVIWGRDYAKAQSLADEQSARTGLSVRATQDPREAAACDVISTVTAASEPVLQGAWVAPGTHVNLVGAHRADAREADGALIVASAVYTDLLESLLNEGGDVVIPIAQGDIDADHVRGEIGNVLRGTISGRSGPQEITVYKSLGVTAQDLFAAHTVYTNALVQGLGADVEFHS